MPQIKVFISSVQSEFAEERLFLWNYIVSDALLGKFFVPFIFEQLPAADNTPQKAYLEEVEHCECCCTQGLYQQFQHTSNVV
jgi:hypothetical protein